MRSALNVESGLNDGIATPVVLVAISGTAVAEGIAGWKAPASQCSRCSSVSRWVRRSAHSGPGAPTSPRAGMAARRPRRDRRPRPRPARLRRGPAHRRQRLRRSLRRRAGLRKRRRTPPEKEVTLVEQSGSLASMISWLIFGALAVPVIVERWSWGMLAYVALSLTLVRMLPVAVSLLGDRFDRYSVVFIGWFGPRGLASVIFALLTLEGLGDKGQKSWPSYRSPS
ncbi:hypothetical protein NKG05_12405 [Oerskovia sp. M15]